MAQAETPKPLKFSSEEMPSQRAWAPVGEDHGLGEIDVAAIAGEAERPLRGVELDHQIGLDLGAHMQRLLLHLLHQPGALDHVGEARIVLDIGRDGELAARLDALDQDRLEHCARGVDRRRVAGGAGADDDDLCMDSGGHFDRCLSRGIAARARNVPGGLAEALKYQS
ncbi:hypothetical protein ACVWWR_001803 [Bradyrhizobium sp. LM3.2]